MFILGVVVAVAVLAQDPTATPAGSVRVAVQADGTSVILRQDAAPPEPLFGSMFGGSEQNSLFNALVNYGLVGNLGAVCGAPRPLSTMIDVERYCEQAGIKRTTSALRELMAPLPADAGSKQAQRRCFDRLIAMTLLARSDDPAAREVLAQTTSSGDRFEAAWANQLIASRDGKPLKAAAPREDLASVLASTPRDAEVIVVFDHAHMPLWRDIWRVAAEVGRTVTRQAVEAAGMEPEAAKQTLADVESLLERGGLLPYEFARRVGNAYVMRTVLAVPASFSGPGMPWLHFDGLFEAGQMETGLRAEGCAVVKRDGVVVATTPQGSRFESTATSLTFDGTAVAERLGAEQGGPIAKSFAVPHLAIGVAVLREGALGKAPLPPSFAPLIDALRTIHLRHDDKGGTHLWLDLRYTDAKVATVAAAALGGMITAARGLAGDAPRAVHELLRDLQIGREGVVVTAEIELDEALGSWLEKLLPLIGR